LIISKNSDTNCTPDFIKPTTKNPRDFYDPHNDKISLDYFHLTIKGQFMIESISFYQVYTF